MSKGASGLFQGTKGEIAFHGNAEDVIALRSAGLDLREHPLQMKQLSSKERRSLAQKVAKRTATRDEYKRYMWDKRFKNRRDKGVRSFWIQEKLRLMRGEKGTRHWTDEQKKDIISGKRPKHNGKTMQSHHAYSASKYPHLADKGEIIYPATHTEHYKGWHGGRYKKSLPGRRIRRIKEF